MLGVSKTNKILNVAIDSPGQSSGWIIGAESPLEESFTDKFFTLQKSSMDSESNRVSNFIEDYESKTLLLHILREKQAECSKDEFESIELSCESQKFWTYLLQTQILNCVSVAKDDMIFYVRYPPSSNYHSSLAEVDVYRINSPNLPQLTSTIINWEETVYLNFILQKFDYYVTCGVCTRTGNKELQVLSKITQKVYASPSHRNMSEKGTHEEIAYPDIFFTIDNFEDAFSSLVIRDGELFVMELVAKDLDGNCQGVLLNGSLRYEEFKKAYDAKSNRMVHKMSFGWIGRKEQKIGFFKIKGPLDKGLVEAAVARVQGSGPDTPQQTPSIENLNDAFFSDLGHRRMSDPNVSRNYQSYGGSLQRHKSRSENENVDKTGLSSSNEVTAKNLEEELDNDQENYHGFVGKSFGQAWHWFKEQMRANSTPLNCFLTYVSLPWHRIVAGKFKAIPSKAIQHFTDVCTFQICWTLGNILSYLATFRSCFELFTLQYFRSYCLFFCKSFRRSEVMDELRANRYFNNTVIRTFACSGLYPNS